MPQRAYFEDKFSDHVSRQTGHSTAADDHCTRRTLHNLTMINDQEPDTSPPTMHELVSQRPRLTSWIVVSTSHSVRASPTSAVTLRDVAPRGSNVPTLNILAPAGDRTTERGPARHHDLAGLQGDAGRPFPTQKP